MTRVTSPGATEQVDFGSTPPQPAMARGVSVVVVNWNGRHLLARCLDSLMTQDYPDYEVILVDNGSADGSVDFVKAQYPSVRVAESPVNLGYAGGCNLGAAESRGEYVVLLNNDTKLSPTLLSRLARALNAHPELGAVSGLAVESLEDTGTTAAQIPVLGVTAKHIVGAYDPSQLFYAPGACVMYRRSIAIPPFDPDYFAYDEDVYLSWWLRLRGYTVSIDFSACFEHEPYSTSRRIKSYVTFTGERNRWTNLLVFYETRTLAKVAPLAVLSIIAKLLSGTENTLAKVRAYVWILLHFRAVMSKRERIQSQRLVRDSEITPHMVGKVVPESSPIKRIANRIVLGYLRAVGVTTMETKRSSNTLR